MKLNIGSNIRTLRRSRDMTQDELAEKLGVTFQTISRWENGGTYPDMELLPVLAGIFDVTVDHLLGMDKEKKREQLEESIRQMQDAIRVRPREDDTVIAILRELRRDMRQYADCIGGMHRVWLTLRWYQGNASPELLEEVRLFHQEYCLYASAMENLWWPAWAMTVIEDEEHLEEHLKKYCTEKKFTLEELLLDRYSLRGEEENLSRMEEICRYTTLRKLFEDNWYLTANDRGMTEYCIAALHLLHGVTPNPEHPVSGDGRLDLWVNIRIGLGWRLAELCLERGETDRAVTVLSDVVGLYESIMQQTEEAKKKNRLLELTSSSSILPTFKILACIGWSRVSGGGECMDVYDVQTQYSIFGDYFESREGITVWNYFSLIEEICEKYPGEPRLADLRERMRKLVITKKV